jgi:hypothetical protein
VGRRCWSDSISAAHREDAALERRLQLVRGLMGSVCGARRGVCAGAAAVHRRYDVQCRSGLGVRMSFECQRGGELVSLGVLRSNDAGCDVVQAPH